MFANIVFEAGHEPMMWMDVPEAMRTWLQAAGGFAIVALVLFGIISWLRRNTGELRLGRPGWQTLLIRVALAGSFASYGLLAILYVPQFLGWLFASVEKETRTPIALGSPQLRDNLLTLGGSFAIVAIALPFVIDGLRLRPRRIWALARLSFKEAVRRRVLWVFSALLLVFLFASWFLPFKPEDQVRNYVQVVDFVMMILLLMSAGLLAAFSIPADVRNQTIHTIVTKPVERFEIVIGRFLGYMLLLTLVLVVMTGASLLYLFREVDPDAKFESMRARVPLYGRLSFRNKAGAYEGVSVGREWEYRRYIPGGAGSPERAIYTFATLPSSLVRSGQTKVPCEFSFDIFRTLKGEEGKGVFCSFSFQTRRWDPRRKDAYDSAKGKGTSDDLLAEQFGIYEAVAKEIVDYHTQAIELPATLFKEDATNVASVPRQGEEPPALQVFVKCDSGGQYVGFAKYDFYLLEREGIFTWNFCKGAAGLWLRICLVVGVAVACSTYLSGVISFLFTAFIYGLGMGLDTIRSIADNTSIGGGPMESFVRLVNRESIVMPLEQTATKPLVLGTDEAYRWLLRVFLRLIPDVDRLDWTDYIAEGFNISTVNMLSLNALMVVGYLLPVAILSYYLIKSREIAA